MKNQNHKVTEREKYQRILESIEVPFTKTTEEAWSEVSARLNDVKASGRVVWMNWKVWSSVAAAAVIAAIVLVINNPRSNTLSVTALFGEVKKVTLPDSSLAYLNAGSSVTYGTDWDSERILSLDGEAFFEVKKGSRFTVNTSRGSVEVLGTSFNVFSRSEKFEVECRTGRVKVKTGTEEVIIEPGECVLLKTGSVAVGSFDADQPGWYNGEFFYTDEPLQNVFKEVERQFNVRIESPDLSDRVFTGSINNKNLLESLDVICLAMALTYEVRTDMTVVIRK